MPSPPPNPPKRNRALIELLSAETLKPLLTLLDSPQITPQVRTIVKSLLHRHIRLTPPTALPPAPQSPTLTTHVIALQSKAVALSARVQSARVAALSYNPPIPSTPPLSPSKPIDPPIHAKLAETAASTATQLATRAKEAQTAAEATRARARSVRGVLRLLADNVARGPDVDAAAEDWTATFTDLPRKRRLSERSTGSPMKSPVYTGANGERVFCPLSPHVTPRSKMRKRLARSAERRKGSAMRQPSFSGGLDLPR